MKLAKGLVVFFLGWPLAAQTNIVTKLVPLHYLDVSTARNMLAKSGVAIAFDERIRALVLSGEGSQITAAEGLLKSLDVQSFVPDRKPESHSVEVLFSFLGASNQAGTAAVPAYLQDVVKQLRAVFPYSNYQLLDTVLLQGREGGATRNVKGVLPESPFGAPAGYARATYNLVYRDGGVSGEKGSRTIRLDGLGLIVKTVSSTDPIGLESSMQSDLTVREGQKVVVGKSSLDAHGAALFLVVTARVLE